MVKRVIIIWVLFAMLIAGAICEQIYIENSIQYMQSKTSTLYQQIQTQYNGEPALQTLNEMQDYWQQREKVLCLLINYKEIKEIYWQMFRLEETMLQNDEENTFIEFTVLKSYIQGSSNVIGFNMQNVF